MPDVSRLREQLAEGTPGPLLVRNIGGEVLPLYVVDTPTATIARFTAKADADAYVAAVNALPKLLKVRDLLAKHEWAAGWPQYEKVCPECFGFAADSPHFGGEKEYGPPGHKPGCALRAALASLETET